MKILWKSLLCLAMSSLGLASSAFADQTPAQAAAMRQWPTTEAVAAKASEAVAGSYCSGILLQDKCEAWRAAAIRKGCVTQSYVDSVLRNTLVPGGLGVAPVCDPVEDTLIGFCKCGCFESSTKLLSFDKESAKADWIQASQIFENRGRFDLFTVADSITSVAEVSHRTLDNAFEPVIGEKALKSVYTFTTALGKISLTEFHAVLLADGRIVAARDVKKTDKLVSYKGEAVAIDDLTFEAREMVPYNVSVNNRSDNPLSHLIYAEGLVIGDLTFQNGLQGALDKPSLRALD